MDFADQTGIFEAMARGLIAPWRLRSVPDHYARDTASVVEEPPAADRDGFCELDEALAEARRRVVSVATSPGGLRAVSGSTLTIFAFPPRRACADRRPCGSSRFRSPLESALDNPFN